MAKINDDDILELPPEVAARLEELLAGREVTLQLREFSDSEAVEILCLLHGLDDLGAREMLSMARGESDGDAIAI